MSFKSAAQSLLRRAGLYNRLKGSFIYDLYWRFADPDILGKRTGELAFYRKLLSPQKNDLIFDIGANHGQKVDIFLRLGARVLAVEPDETNQAILRQKFLSYRVRKKPVTIVGKAVSDTVRVEEMFVDAPGSAKNTLNRKWVETLKKDQHRFGNVLEFEQRRSVQTTTLEELIREFGHPTFIKIDVEGYEPAVLRGLHQSVSCISFEVNLPEFAEEGIECAKLLSKLSSKGSFNLAADCRNGMLLERWINGEGICDHLRKTPHPCVEVFWKSG